jgi:hypothetical protein
MITEDKKELEIALTTYIDLKKNQAECTGFIDGFEVAIKHLRKGQILPIDIVSKCLCCDEVKKLTHCEECGNDIGIVDN